MILEKKLLITFASLACLLYLVGVSRRTKGRREGRKGGREVKGKGKREEKERKGKEKSPSDDPHNKSKTKIIPRKISKFIQGHSVIEI